MIIRKDPKSDRKNRLGINRKKEKRTRRRSKNEETETETETDSATGKTGRR